jgi:hypothetical protein
MSASSVLCGTVLFRFRVKFRDAVVAISRGVMPRLGMSRTTTLNLKLVA